MHLVKKMTVRYDAREDRLQLAVACLDDRSFKLWLTARLAQALVAGVLKKLNETGTEHASTPLQQHTWEQSAALLSQPRSAPVSTAEPCPYQLVEAVAVARRKDVFVLTFRGTNQLNARMPLPDNEMRQWLHIVYLQFIKANWPLQVWPHWLRHTASERQQAPTPVLH